MEIKFNAEISSVPHATGAASKPKPAATDASEVSLQQSDALNQTLAQVPPTRIDEVARAKVLVASPNYPPLVMMQKLARLLAAEQNDNS
jgi:hypothetical protein